MEDIKFAVEKIRKKEGPSGVLRFCKETLSHLPKEPSYTSVWLKLYRLGALITLKRFKIPDSEFEDLEKEIDLLDPEPKERASWKGLLFNSWGISLGSRGFFAQAAEKYQLGLEETVAFSPNDIGALNNIGLNIMYLGKWEAARQIFLDGLQNVLPDDVDGRAYLLVNYGELLRRWGKGEAQCILEEALACFKKMEDQEGIAEAAHNLVRLLLDNEQLKEAEKLVKVVRKLRPGPYEQYCQLFQLRTEALWALAHQETEQGIDLYTSALDLVLEIHAHEHVMAVQYDIALIYLRTAVAGDLSAIDQIQLLLAKIVEFADTNDLQFILVETLLVQAKFSLWMQDYMKTYELLAKINRLLVQFPYDHLKTRFSHMEHELEAWNPRLSVEHLIQLDLSEFMEYLRDCSKLA